MAIFVKSYAHTYRPYMVQPAVERNVNKHADAVLNHNCIKFTVMHIVLL